MKMLGGLLIGLGFLCWIGFGLWAFIIDFSIVHHVAGFWGIVAGLIVAPVTFAAAPLYAIVAWNNWFPAAVEYGGALAGYAFFFLGGIMAGE